MLYSHCMTEMLAVRLSRDKMARLKAAAKKRSVTRSEMVRQLVEKFLMDEKPGPGVGWKEHFEWLRKHGQKVDSRIADEIREMIALAACDEAGRRYQLPDLRVFRGHQPSSNRPHRAIC